MPIVIRIPSHFIPETLHATAIGWWVLEIWVTRQAHLVGMPHTAGTAAIGAPRRHAQALPY